MGLGAKRQGPDSWWDDRRGAFLRNQGLRIHPIGATRVLAERSRSSRNDAAARAKAKASDPVPGVAVLGG